MSDTEQQLQTRGECCKREAQCVTEIVAQYAEEMSKRAPDAESRTAYDWIATAVRRGEHVKWARERYMGELKTQLDKLAANDA